VTAWHGAARGAAALLGLERRLRSKTARRCMGRAWSAWRGRADRSRALLPSLAASFSAARGEVLQRAALLAWCGAAAEAGGRRRADGRRVEALRRRRLQRVAFGALRARVERRREQRRAEEAASAGAARRLLRRCAGAWSRAAQQGRARADAVAELQRKRAAALERRVASAWLARVQAHRRRGQAEALIQQKHTTHLLASALAAWKQQLETVDASVMTTAWQRRRLRRRFGAWRDRAQRGRRQLVVAGVVWHCKVLRAWQGAVAARQRAEEELKACLRRKRVAFRAFKR
jgi:hypothetical protein